MTSHKSIMVWGDHGPDSVTGRWSANTYDGDDAVKYVPSDLTQAAVAAALEGAAGVSFPATWREDASEAHKGAAWSRDQRLWSAGFNACRDAIRALITQQQHDDLTAHVAAEVAKARAEDAATVLRYRPTGENAKHFVDVLVCDIANEILTGKKAK